MASVQVQTSSSSRLGGDSRCIDIASSRLWAVVQGGASGSDTEVNLYYSDDSGSTWTKKADLMANSSVIPAIKCYQDSGGTWHVAVLCGHRPTGSETEALTLYQIHSNVNTGTPGSVTSATVIDAGGANAGWQFVALEHSPSVSNRRLWIVGGKRLTSTTWGMKYGYAGEGTTADTAGNWTLGDVQGGTSGTLNNHNGCMAYWTVGGNPKLTIVYQDDAGSSPQKLYAVTFDPSASSPSIGSSTEITSLVNNSGSFTASEWNDGGMCSVVGKADYLVVARRTAGGSTDLAKTADGTTWAQPAGWSGLSTGRMSLCSDGTNFYFVYVATLTAIASAVDALKYRKITAASDSMGGETSFSDTNGALVSTPRNTGTSLLLVVYRGSTSSPYTVRFDSTAISGGGGGGGDTTAPGAATGLTATPNSNGTTIALSFTTPADVDLSQYKVQYSTSAYPAAHTDGTSGVAATTAAPSTSYAPSLTGLTAGTRYYISVFLKDTTGNWNTGTRVTAVAATLPAFSEWQTSAFVTATGSPAEASVNPVAVFQLATGNFEAGKVATFRFQLGTGSGAPPTGSVVEYLSTTNAGVFQYEASAGVWTDVPLSGLATTHFAKKLRVKTDVSGTVFYGALRIEQ